MITRAIELTNCADPHALLRMVAANVPHLASLVTALAPREDAPPVGTIELPGARVHVVPITQEQRADGSITPPAAVVIVDGPEAEAVAAALDKALLAGAEVKTDYAELRDGVRVVLDGPPLADVGNCERRAKAERIAAAQAEAAKKRTDKDAPRQ